MNLPINLVNKKMKIDPEILQVIFDSIDISVSAIDISSHKILYINATTRKIFGDCLGKRCWKIMQLNQTGPCSFCQNHQLFADKDFSSEAIVWESFNTYTKRWFEHHCRRIPWIDERKVYLQLIYDITDRKNNEQRLNTYKTRYGQLLDQIDTAIAVYAAADNTGSDFVFKDFNAAACKIDNINKDKVIGKKLLDVFPGAKDFGIVEIFQRVYCTGVPEYFPVKYYQDNRIDGWRENYVFKLTTGEVAAFYEAIPQKKQPTSKSKKILGIDQLLNVTLDLKCFINNEGYLFQPNKAWEKILGYAAPELDNKMFLDFVHPEDTQATYDVLKKLHSGENDIVDHVNRFRHSDGSYRWIRWYLAPYSFKDGGCCLLEWHSTRYSPVLYVVARDITEQKIAEQKLYASEEQLRAITQALPDVAIIVDEEGRFIDILSGFDDQNLYRNKNEFIGKLTKEVFLPEQTKMFMDVITKTIVSNQTQTIEYSLPFPGGKTWFEARTSIISSINSPKKLLVILARDITKRKHAEERFTIAFRENLSSMTITHLETGKFIDVNNAFLQMTEFERNEVIGKNSIDLNIFTSATRTLLLKELESHGSVKNYEIEFRTKSGKTKIGLFSAEIVTINDEKCILIMCSDMTEHHQMYKALLNSEQRFKDIVYSIGDWIFEVDENFVITYYSGNSESILGYSSEEMLGKIPYEFIDPENLKNSQKEITNLFLQRKPFKDHLTWLIAKNGSRLCFLTSAVPIFNDQSEFKGFRGINKDITAFKNTEKALRQLQKKEAIGALAGSIAHDINTILTVIVGYGNVLYWKIKDNDALSCYVKKILEASEKAGAFTQNLLAFGREQPAVLKQIDLNQLIKNFNELLLRLIGENITIKTNFNNNELKVNVDTSQMEQVLMNLVVNAKDALPKGGTIAISTSDCVLPENFITKTGTPKPGRYAVLQVSDNGIGIEKKNQDKILEPFFTNKATGTGLGLAIICNILKQHSGYLNFHSEVNCGCTFDIYLPITGSTLPQDKAKENIELCGRGETILFVEDEKMIRTLYKEILEEFDYKIIVAKDGMDAITKVTKHQDEIDLILMDIVMPKLNGKDAAVQIRKIKPKIKILFISGYPDNFIKTQEINSGAINLIKKPITPANLLTKIREILSAD